MKVKVIKDACIGCGACTTIAPDYFELNDEGLSNAKKEVVDVVDKEDVEDAANACPTSAIEIEE